MKTSDYYKKNPDSYAKKKAYDKEYNKSKEATKKRSKLNRFNRKKKTYGNGDGLDACHKKYKGKSIIKFCKASSNRGDKDDTKGDKKARGKKS